MFRLKEGNKSFQCNILHRSHGLPLEENATHELLQISQFQAQDYYTSKQKNSNLWKSADKHSKISPKANQARKAMLKSQSSRKFLNIKTFSTNFKQIASRDYSQSPIILTEYQVIDQRTQISKKNIEQSQDSSFFSTENEQNSFTSRSFMTNIKKKNLRLRKLYKKFENRRFKTRQEIKLENSQKILQKNQSFNNKIKISPIIHAIPMKKIN